MANLYSDPRSSSIIATDEIPTVYYRRGSRKLSAIKEDGSNGSRESSQNLLQLLKPMNLEADDDDPDSNFILKEEPYAAEGLWGWIIVGGAFLANVVVDGISLSNGVLQESVTKKDNLTKVGDDMSDVEDSSRDDNYMSVTHYQAVVSTCLAVTLITGPFASLLTEKFGSRITAMVGSVIATIGFLLAWGISPEIPDFTAFLIGYGILGGIGFGILFSVSVVIVGQNFDKNVALATGITVAGTGVGTFVVAPATEWIVVYYKWQGVLIFYAILAGISILFGSVYRPLPTRVVKVSRSEESANRTSMPIKQQLAELLTSPSYLILCFSGSLLMMGYFTPFSFLTDSAKQYINRDAAVFLIAIVGISNAVGRVLFGFLASRIGHSLTISNIAMTVGGIVTIFYPFATTHAWLIVCSVIFGSYAAVVAALRSVIIKEVVGPEKFNVGFGLSLLFMGVATLGNILGGYLKDRTNTYDMSFYVAGAFLVFSGVICYPVPWVWEYEQRRAKTKNLPMKGYNPEQRRSLVDIDINT